MSIVFAESAYKLTKCSSYPFWFCIIGASIAAFCGIFGLITWILPLYFYGYVIGLLFALILAIYLPSLFIYKLFQINKQVMENNSLRSRPSVIQTSTSPTDSPSGSPKVNANGSRFKRKRTTEMNRDNSILMVIRKCTILTFVSLISTWTIFVCLITASQSCCSDLLLAIWGYAMVIDRCMNFICVMLSNNFCDEYYVKLCGWIDKCVGKCCFKEREVVVGGGKEKELSSYIESAPTVVSQQTSDFSD